ncbi:MAG: PhoX family phosphatase [Alphaproteobacteria bacterium]|nr:PhoX family phosphatase [Alphaproteobacteria bacterium]
MSENSRLVVANRSLRSLVDAHVSRRSLLLGGAGAAMGSLVSLKGWERPALAQAGAAPAGVSSLDFDDIPQVIADQDAVAKGYTKSVLIRWGDKVLADAPAFDPKTVSGAAQAKQFGFNNDFIGYLPLPKGSNASDHGLLFVNHEYGTVHAMFPAEIAEKRTPEHTAQEMEAHGASVIEVIRENGSWKVVEGSTFARRITMTTEIAISGPAAGHDRLKTSEDPSGMLVKGMVNNCSGGITPWGTVLTCEENFNSYFGGALPIGSPEAEYDDRLSIRVQPFNRWFVDVARFDRSKEPNEKNRFGWIIEIDPYDPTSQPVKRTALGRFKHEAATTVVAPDGRIVVYSGDDQFDEYIYKWVSAKPYDPSKPGMAQGLLDEGTLYVAVFGEKTVEWRPMVFGQGPLTAENGFASQADVLINARKAGDLLEGTKMDRPEDVEVSPVTGRVYAVMTGNKDRTEDQINPANPRSWNLYGHIVEMIPPTGADNKADHAALVFAWDILLLGGTMADPAQYGGEYPKWSGRYGAGTKVKLANPDNIAFDPKGRLWIGTDQIIDHSISGQPDGLFACDLDGPGRAVVKFFYACPRGAELCGPAFTPDGTTLFAAVQHPGQAISVTNPGFLVPLDLSKPSWPDFQPGLPPRPSVIVITRDAGGPVGG